MELIVLLGRGEVGEITRHMGVVVGEQMAIVILPLRFKS